jgi:hypothetical protein
MSIPIVKKTAPDEQRPRFGQFLRHLREPRAAGRAPERPFNGAAADRR